MKKILTLTIALFITLTACTNKEATPKEVVLKVHKAANLLKEQGNKALPILRNNKSEYTWKDTYIFLVDANTNIVLSNPAFREREGGNMSTHLDWDKKEYGKELLALAKNGGGWMEFTWPKPGTNNGIRKVSYIYPISGYIVCAGVYNDDLTIKELNNLTKEILNNK